MESESSEWKEIFSGLKAIALPNSSLGVRGDLAVCVELDRARKTVLVVKRAGSVGKNSINLGF